MLTIFRRHLRTCKHRSKGRSYRHSDCPISVEGRYGGKMIRQSLDIRSWEGAQKIVRDWASGNGKMESPAVAGSHGALYCRSQFPWVIAGAYPKSELIRDELIAAFGGTRIDRISADELGEVKEAWKVRPSTAIKKLERVRSFFKFCVDRDWIAKNPAKALKAPKEIVIAIKPYDDSELKRIA